MTVHVYTDNSSDKTIINGGSGVFLTTVNGTTHQCMNGGGNKASNFTYELQAIVQALDIAKSSPPLRSRQMDESSFVIQERTSRKFQRETLSSPIRSSSFYEIFKN